MTLIEELESERSDVEKLKLKLEEIIPFCEVSKDLAHFLSEEVDILKERIKLLTSSIEDLKQQHN